MSKVGIFSGTFDPVHAGHIAFALDAIKKAKLEKVYFMPERKPRRKTGVTHYAHRVAMLRLALKPYTKLDILDLPDSQFSVNKTMPRINKLLPDSEIFLLVGSDMVGLLSTQEAEIQWPDYKKLLSSVTLVVGVRNEANYEVVKMQLQLLQSEGMVIMSKRPNASSRLIRKAHSGGKQHKESLKSLDKYIKDNWLYASLATES